MDYLKLGMKMVKEHIRPFINALFKELAYL